MSKAATPFFRYCTLSLLSLPLVLALSLPACDLGRASDDAGSPSFSTPMGVPVGQPSTMATSIPPLPPIKHVFLIVLENNDYQKTFDNPAAPLYKFRNQGETLQYYYGIGHSSLDNYIAMISGQPPNLATRLDCPVFMKFHKLDIITKFKRWLGFRLTNIAIPNSRPEPFGHPTDPDPKGIDSLGHTSFSVDPRALQIQSDIVDGIGCVYPKEVRTVANQLEETPGKDHTGMHYTWRAYMEGRDQSSRVKEDLRCGHPELGHWDETNTRRNFGYTTRHNPFAYFESLIDKGTAESRDGGADCVEHERSLDELSYDLSHEGLLMPNFVFITPNLCNDGHTDCKQAGEDGEIAAIRTFLTKWICRIRESTAYRKDGIIIITFDEAKVHSRRLPRPRVEAEDHPDDSVCDDENRSVSACCGEGRLPPRRDPGIEGSAGGRVGAIVLSKWVKSGSINGNKYNHYSLLRSIEKIFHTKEYLGLANSDDLVTFDEGGVFNQPSVAPETSGASVENTCF
jgi:hypothetical protein